MEDVLDLYAEEPNPKRPVICFDESPIQLIGEVSLSVKFTTCFIFLAVNGLRPGGRVASFNKPSPP
jgi:hypothetical protein